MITARKQLFYCYFPLSEKIYEKITFFKIPILGFNLQLFFFWIFVYKTHLLSYKKTPNVDFFIKIKKNIFIYIYFDLLLDKNLITWLLLLSPPPLSTSSRCPNGLGSWIDLKKEKIINASITDFMIHNLTQTRHRFNCYIFRAR